MSEQIGPDEAAGDEQADVHGTHAGTCIFARDEVENFIPFRHSDVVEMCLAEGHLPADRQQDFREFCEILSAWYHFEYHHRLEVLKDKFAPFNPDADTRMVTQPAPEDRATSEHEFMDMLREVLVGANYEHMDREDLEANLTGECRFKVRLVVDLDDFAELMVFTRGKRDREEVQRTWLGLKKETVTAPYFDRVAIYLRLKDADYFRAKGVKHPPFEPGSAYLKLFKDVPVDDLEITFPNARVGMRLIDKIVIGVPAAVGGIAVLATKLYATLLLVFGLLLFWLGLRDEEVQIRQHHLVVLGIGLATLGGYVFRQVSKFKNRRLRYLKNLSESLYFKVLDNNAGVLDHLIDAAEEEDNKEAVLAYYFLLTQQKDLTEPQLDATIERWFCEKHGVKLDFEVDDALAKLIRVELAWRDDTNVLHVPPLTEAKRRIDEAWDNYFEYNSKA